MRISARSATVSTISCSRSSSMIAPHLVRPTRSSPDALAPRKRIGDRQYPSSVFQHGQTSVRPEKVAGHCRSRVVGSDADEVGGNPIGSWQWQPECVVVRCAATLRARATSVPHHRLSLIFNPCAACGRSWCGRVWWSSRRRGGVRVLGCGTRAGAQGRVGRVLAHWPGGSCVGGGSETRG